MTSNPKTIGVPQAGFFRSSVATMIAGLCAGGSVIASAVNASPIEAALATLLTAAAVAVADWLARRRRERAHENKFLKEHRDTRALIEQLRNERRKQVK